MLAIFDLNLCKFSSEGVASHIFTFQRNNCLFFLRLNKPYVILFNLLLCLFYLSRLNLKLLRKDYKTFYSRTVLDLAVSKFERGVPKTDAFVHECWEKTLFKAVVNQPLNSIAIFPLNYVLVHALETMRTTYT